MTLQEIVTAVKAEGGIDATDEQVRVWVMDRYRRLVAGAQWMRRERSLGQTVALQDRFTIPTDVVDVRWVAIDGSSPYSLISVDELQRLRSGESFADGPVFAQGFDPVDDTESVRVWPVPGSDGLEVTAMVAVVPPNINLSDEPAIPRDFDHALVAGGIADGLKRMDEAHAEAGAWEAEFYAAIDELRVRRSSRVGSGPQQLRVRR